MFLHSDTLQLRAPELADLDFMFRIENDTRLWSVSACKTPYSRFLLQQYIETNTHDIYADKQARLMIEERTTGQLVGAIDLFDFSPADHRAEVGVVIERDFRGQGYAKEALALLCQYGQRVLALHQLYAYILEDNTPARQLFATSGFREVARLADWVFFDARYRTVCLYQYIFEK